MIDTIYIESEIKKHPRSIKIIDKLKPKRIIEINSYQSIFNRKNQSYQLQKEKKSLILAKKHEIFFHKIKTNDSIGADEHFYFSSVLNCPFSCKYCFLQGIYRSSHFVVFVNFEDFQKNIEKKILSTKDKKLCFFAGYDTDTLATDNLSFFIEDFYPFFKKHKNTLFEIRTKSSNIFPLFNKKSIGNLVIAFSLNPDLVIKKIELKTPTLKSRLKTIQKLMDLGFQIGLRFDPIIYFQDFEKEYSKFFENVFSNIDANKVHSITLGSIRFPLKFFENMKKKNMYLEFLASINGKMKNRVGYKNENQILKYCENQVLKFYKEKIFIHF